MYKQWPLGQLPSELQRPELNQLKDRGYSFGNPTEVVDIFEKKVSDFCGSKFAVAVDCCSNAIFLILKYINNPQKVKIPYFTYASVPMQILHAGYEFEFVDKKWSGTYKLEPLDVWDFAGRWTKGMYEGGFAALSFQIKKRLPIGRGGMILCDDYDVPLISYSLAKKCDIIISTLTSIADECISIEKPVILVDYTHNMHGIFSDIYPNQFSSIIAKNNQDLLVKFKNIYESNSFTLSNYKKIFSKVCNKFSFMINSSISNNIEKHLN
jgi:dTDP-4-amino-4,6-dideoxygalactose transaminase